MNIWADFKKQEQYSYKKNIFLSQNCFIAMFFFIVILLVKIARVTSPLVLSEE